MCAGFLIIYLFIWLDMTHNDSWHTLRAQNIFFNHECEKPSETYSIQIGKVREETQNQVEEIAF